MGVTRVTRTKNGAGAINYVLRPKEKNKERVLAVAGSNVSTEFALEQMAMTRKMYDKEGVNARTGGKYIQAYRIIQSFSDKELDPDNPEDIEKCNALGYELAQEAYPDHEVLVVTHGDGVGGKLHNHLIVNATSFETGKQLRGDRKEWKWIADKSDEILQKNGIEPLQRSDHDKDKRTKAEIHKASRGEYVWKDDLRGRINGAYEDERSIDKESFEKVLNEEYGVYTRRWSEKKNNVTFHFSDEDGNERKATSRALGNGYTKESVDAVLSENKETFDASNRVEPKTNYADNMSVKDIMRQIRRKTTSVPVATPIVEEKEPTSVKSDAVIDKLQAMLDAQRKAKEDDAAAKIAADEEAKRQDKIAAEQAKQKEEDERKRKMEEKERAERLALEARRQQEELERQRKIQEMRKRKADFLENDYKKVVASHEFKNGKTVLLGYRNQRTNKFLTDVETKWYKERKEELKQKKGHTKAVEQSHDLEL